MSAVRAIWSRLPRGARREALFTLTAAFAPRIARPAPTLVFFERIQFMYQPWLTTRDWPVRALEGKAAKRWATSATSSIVVKA